MITSNKLLNLWDMLKEYSVTTSKILAGLTLHIGALQSELTDAQYKILGSAIKARELKIESGDVSQLKSYLPLVMEFVEDLDLEMTALSAKRIHRAFGREDYLKHRLLDDLNDLRNRMHDELTSRQFLFVTPKYAKYYRQPDLFGPEVNDSFSSAALDIADAGTALATGLSTACVMHLMRALETPIFLLATSLGHTPNREAWGEILLKIRPLIAALPNSHPQQQIFFEAAVQFRFFKNAWRDHAMHAKQRYTLDDAMVIYNAVKAFMESMAPHLHE